MNISQIPSIDIAPFFTSDPAKKAAVAQAVAQACENIGFFTVTGHGIPLDRLHAANAAARAFFDLPATEKIEYRSDGGMGYIGVAGENLAASLDDGATADYKESLNLSLPVDPATWPGRPSELRGACEQYYRDLLNLALNLMRIFALALDLPEGYFDDKVDRPYTVLRLLNYPPMQQPDPGQVRAGAHTDYGTLTILWSEDPRGLQARTRRGEWVDVVARPDALIINLGDLMMNWTNDRWLSTLHRVVPLPGHAVRRRQSMAFFHNPNPDTIIECIETCVEPGHPVRYEPILAKDHLSMKISKSLTDSAD